MRTLESIIVKHINDTDADMTYLGEFSDTAEGDFSINHSNNPRHYKYFNANNVENMEHAMENYQRACTYGESWHYIGIKVYAEVAISDDGKHWGIIEVESNGLWGIESDSSPEYLAEVAEEEMGTLKAELIEMGISSGDIMELMKNCKTVEEY